MMDWQEGKGGTVCDSHGPSCTDGNGILGAVDKGVLRSPLRSHRARTVT